MSVLGRLSYFGSWVDPFAARFVVGADAPILDGRYIADPEASVSLTE